AELVTETRRVLAITAVLGPNGYELMMAAERGCTVAELRAERQQLAGRVSRSSGTQILASGDEHLCPLCAARGEHHMIPASWKHCGCLSRTRAGVVHQDAQQ